MTSWGRLNLRMAWRIAVTYIGTVVGAGFASGQEILQFFSRYGEQALLGILISTLGFFLCGDFVMRLGRNHGVDTFGDVAVHLFGKRFGRVVHVALLLMLFGVTMAMLAGSGALFAEQARVPFVLGALLCAGLTALTLIGGLRGLMSANAVIVPLMMAFIAWAFVYGLFWGHLVSMTWAAPVQALRAPVPIDWLLAAALYVGFNISLSVTVLIPLGREAGTRMTLTVGTLLGALGLGIMLTLLHILLASFYGRIATFEIPMGQLVTLLSSSLAPGPIAYLLRAGFVAVLWGEIFSTLLANVYGLAAEISPRVVRSRMTRVLLILTFAFALCQIGFAHIVEYFYPVFGYAGLMILVLGYIRERRYFRV